MSTPTRTETTGQKVATEFGAMYVHIDVDRAGRPVSGSISTPGKEPGSQIARLIAALSEGLNAALQGADGSLNCDTERGDG